MCHARPNGRLKNSGPSFGRFLKPSPELKCGSSNVERRTYLLTTRDKRKAVALIVGSLQRNWRVEIKPPVRTLPQNDLMWAWLTAFSEQAEWNGKKRSTLDWKDLFTGAVKVAAGGVEAVPGLEGGLMLLGLRTSDMSVSEMADLITYMESKAAEWGVVLPRDTDDGKGGSGANNLRADAA